MVSSFSTPNRENLTIENIEKCALNRDDDTQQFFEQPESTPSEQPPNLPDSATSAPSENDEAQGGTPEQPNSEQPPTTTRRPLLNRIVDGARGAIDSVLSIF